MKLAAACLLTLLAPLAHAQWWFFESRPYYNPLIAGVRDPNFSAMIPARFDRMSMMITDQKKRTGWDVDVGGEMPIFGYGLAVGDTKDVAKGRWGWGLWIPIDFHMIEAFGADSAPIINTDYRFSAMLKVRHQYASERWFGARLQFGHESTHLGDEYTIEAHQQRIDQYERINVSWQYLDLGAMLESARGSLWNVRAGVTTTVPFASSYYQTGLGTVTESTIGPVTLSKNWYDPYLGAEYTWTKVRDKGYDAYLSSEMRYRSVYDYHKRSDDQAEERQASFNIIAGIKKTGRAAGIGHPSLFARVYHGVNPHGQFRNQKNYTEVGIGVRLIP